MTDPGERLRRKRQAYLHTFCGDFKTPHPEATRVLADLRHFCGIDRGGLIVSPKSGMTDPYATIYRAALRDVYLRIATFINIDESMLFQESDHAGSKPDPDTNT